MQMEKQLMVEVTNINNAQDKKFCFETFDSIINSLLDFEGIATKIRFNKTDDAFDIRFNLKVCKTGDMIWVLIKEFLSCISQTEENVNIIINEEENDQYGTTYKFLRYNKLNTCDNNTKQPSNV